LTEPFVFFRDLLPLPFDIVHLLTFVFVESVRVQLRFKLKVFSQVAAQVAFSTSSS
jgi:hypothetical protein